MDITSDDNFRPEREMAHNVRYNTDDNEFKIHACQNQLSD